MNRTKIIVTYGPSLEDKRVLRAVLNYVDIVRINLSHGDRKSWLEHAANVRTISKDSGREIALIADLPGPKIRVGILNKPIAVKKGQTIIFSCAPAHRADTIPVEYKNLHKDAKRGKMISIGDGQLTLRVNKISGRNVECKALNSGKIISRKGINLHGIEISAEVPTEEDLKLAKFALANKFDFVAASFIRSPRDIDALRRACPGLFIIAKIERKSAVSEIRQIAKSADAIMVARGDLAFDVKIEKIPVIQRKVITASREAHKPVIVATQVLASMVENSMPTRAEVNDIASAVVTRADCIMLSDETAIGKYPVAAVRVLSNTIKNAESYIEHSMEKSVLKNEVSGSIAFAAAELANNFNIEFIFAPTQTGATAKRLSMLRPRPRIIAMARSPKIRRKLAIYYGIEPLPIRRYSGVDSMFRLISEEAGRRGIKRYVVVFGMPNKPGSTDTLRYIER